MSHLGQVRRRLPQRISGCGVGQSLDNLPADKVSWRRISSRCGGRCKLYWWVYMVSWIRLRQNMMTAIRKWSANELEITAGEEKTHCTSWQLIGAGIRCSQRDTVASRNRKPARWAQGRCHETKKYQSHVFDLMKNCVEAGSKTSLTHGRGRSSDVCNTGIPFQPYTEAGI